VSALPLKRSTPAIGPKIWPTTRRNGPWLGAARARAPSSPTQLATRKGSWCSRPSIRPARAALRAASRPEWDSTWRRRATSRAVRPRSSTRSSFRVTLSLSGAASCRAFLADRGDARAVRERSR